MSFQDAVRLAFTRATDFKGRSSVAEFWYFFVFQLGVSIALSIAGMIVGVPMLGVVGAVVLLLPFLAVAVRRLHDLGKTGKLLIIGLFPLLGLYLLVLFAQQGHRGANKYGPPSGAGGVMTTA